MEQVCFMKKKLLKYEPLYILISYSILALLMYWTIRADFVWYGDDTYYHFLRIIGLSDNFKHGLLQSGVSTSFFGKIGYGQYIFYPWITLIPFSFFKLLTASWIQAYYLGLMFYFFVSFLISHYVMKKFSNSTFQAVIFAVVYNFSTYRLIDFFSRAAIGEYLATIFLPLCFLGFYELFFGDNKNWKILAIGMSLIIFSHILTTFMCLLIFVLILIIFSPKVKLSKNRLLDFGKAVGTTILATLIFTVPFIIEEFSQDYGIPGQQALKGKSLLSLITSSFLNTSGRSFEGHIYNIGLILILALLLGIIIFKKFDFTTKAIFTLVILTFIMSSSFFPWKFLQNTPIGVIQFPFRNLIFATLFSSIIAAKSLSILIKNNHFSITIAVISVTLISGSLWYSSFNKSLVNSFISQDNLVITEKMVNRHNIPENYLDQYIPKKVQKYLPEIKQHLGYINGKKFLQIPGIRNSTNYFELANIKKGDVVDLPYVRYRFTKIRLNGSVEDLLPSKRGTVRFVAPTDFNKLKIQINYDVPAFQLIFVISLLAWLFLII